MIYTSYYAKLRQIPKEFGSIAISRGVPAWYQGHSYSQLAPLWETVSKYKQTGDNISFAKEYKETILGYLNANQVSKELKKLCPENSDIVLLCYEKSSDFCHRHLLAEWFRSNGIDCKEWQ